MAAIPVYAYEILDYVHGGGQGTVYTFATAAPPSTMGVAGIKVSRYGHRLVGYFYPSSDVTAKVAESHGGDLVLFLTRTDGGEIGYSALEVIKGAPKIDGWGRFSWKAYEKYSCSSATTRQFCEKTGFILNSHFVQTRHKVGKILVSGTLGKPDEWRALAAATEKLGAPYVYAGRLPEHC